MNLYQIPSSHFDWSKIMATRGRDYFAVYGYSENLTNLLPRKCLASFQIISLYQIPSDYVDWSKNMTAIGLFYIVYGCLEI